MSEFTVFTGTLPDGTQVLVTVGGFFCSVATRPGSHDLWGPQTALDVDHVQEG